MARRGLLTPLVAGIVLGLLAPAPASAVRAGAGSCRLEFDVSFDPGGAMRSTGPGLARCTGTVGSATADPSPARATVSGLAHHAFRGCMPDLDRGRFELLLRRLVSFGPGADQRVTGSWIARGSHGSALLRGHGNVNGVPIGFLGSAAFTPDASACALTGFYAGRLRMDLVVASDGAALRPRRARAS